MRYLQDYRIFKIKEIRKKNDLMSPEDTFQNLSATHQNLTSINDSLRQLKCFSMLSSSKSIN